MCISRCLGLAIFKQLYKYIVPKGYNIFPIKETEVSKQTMSDLIDPAQIFPKSRIPLPLKLGYNTKVHTIA